MKIDSINTGYVIDHIPAGNAMKLYHLLGLDKLSCPVAMIMNAASRRMGSKDIIKIDGDISINMDVIGYLTPGAAVNVIRDGVLIEKRTLDLPERLINVVTCRNPRCISTTEQGLKQCFTLSDRTKKIYRCYYCEARQS